MRQPGLRDVRASVFFGRRRESVWCSLSENMDAVRMLVHDHEVLTSQVEHVAALVNGLLQKSFEPAMIREELMQQVELLKDQLLEHFGFEEEAAFPFLMKAMPNDASRLQAMSVDHDRIARHLVEVAELL